jgi:hypothetical protein
MSLLEECFPQNKKDRGCDVKKTKKKHSDTKNKGKLQPCFHFSRKLEHTRISGTAEAKQQGQ